MEVHHLLVSLEIGTFRFEDELFVCLFNYVLLPRIGYMVQHKRYFGIYDESF